MPSLNLDQINTVSPTRQERCLWIMVTASRAVAWEERCVLYARVIGILPSFDRHKCNEYVDIPIPTGIDVVRNAITGAADAVIAIGGGAGTLSEMAFAWTQLRLIIGYRTVPGWAQKLADQRIDGRIRYPEIEDDRVYGADTPEEAAMILEKLIEKYDKSFDGISWIDPRKV